MTQAKPVVTPQSLSKLIQFNPVTKEAELDYELIRRELAKLEFAENPPVTDTYTPEKRTYGYSYYDLNGRNADAKWNNGRSYIKYFLNEGTTCTPFNTAVNAERMVITFNVLLPTAEELTADQNILFFSANGVGLSVRKDQETNAICIDYPSHGMDIYFDDRLVSNQYMQEVNSTYSYNNAPGGELMTVSLALYGNSATDIYFNDRVTDVRFYAVKDINPDVIEYVMYANYTETTRWNREPAPLPLKKAETFNVYEDTNIFNFYKKHAKPIQTMPLFETTREKWLEQNPEYSLTTIMVVMNDESITTDETNLAYIGASDQMNSLVHGVKFFKKATEPSEEYCFMRHEMTGWTVYLDHQEIKPHQDYRIVYGRPFIITLTIRPANGFNLPYQTMTGYTYGYFWNTELHNRHVENAVSARTKNLEFTQQTDSMMRMRQLIQGVKINNEVYVEMNLSSMSEDSVQLDVHASPEFNRIAEFRLDYVKASGTTAPSQLARQGYVLLEAPGRTGTEKASTTFTSDFTGLYHGFGKTDTKYLSNISPADGILTVTQTNSQTGESISLVPIKHHAIVWVKSEGYEQTDDFSTISLKGEYLPARGSRISIGTQWVPSNTGLKHMSPMLNEGGHFIMDNTLDAQPGPLRIDLIVKSFFTGYFGEDTNWNQHFVINVPEPRTFNAVGSHFVPVSDPTQRTFALSINGRVHGSAKVRAVLSKFSDTNRGSDADVVRVFMDEVSGEYNRYMTFNVPLSLETVYIDVEFQEDNGYTYTKRVTINAAAESTDQNRTGRVYLREAVNNARIAQGDTNTLKFDLDVNPSYTGTERQGRRIIVMYTDSSGLSYVKTVEDISSSTFSIPLTTSFGRAVSPNVKLMIVADNMESVEETISKVTEN